MGLTLAGHILDAYTVALWRLDESSASATAVDETTTYPLDIITGSPPVVAGKIGNARAFTINKGISRSGITPTDKLIQILRSGTFTAEAWFWVDPSVTYPAAWPGAGNNHAVLFGVVGAANGTSFMFGLGDTGFFIYNVNGNFVAAGSWAGIPLGTWHHLAVRSTWKDATNSTVDFFLDGVKVASTTILTYVNTPSTNGAVAVGGEGSTFNTFTGRIDDCRFSNIARTDDEIFESFRRGMVGLPPTSAPYNTSHLSSARARLIQQYKNRANHDALLSAISGEFQTVEDTLNVLRWMRVITNSSGSQLDKMGRMVGVKRNGLQDEPYRTRLLAQVLLNISSGSPEDLYAITAAMLALFPGATLKVAEYFPAAFVLRAGGVAIPNPTDIAAVIQQAKDAGVRAVLEYNTDTDANSFTMEAQAAFLTVASIVTATTLTVDDTSAFPITGSLRIDDGLSTAETVTYSAKTATSFTISAATQAHAISSTVQLVGSVGLGYGDTADAAAGGNLAGAI